MDLSYCKQLRLFGFHLNSLACKCLLFVFIVLVFGEVCLHKLSGLDNTERRSNIWGTENQLEIMNSDFHGGRSKFLKVPQIIWGLNNQKIALARALLTARMMNRTLLMPSLSASLFYKEVDLLKPVFFDKIFQFEKFNSLCKGFVHMSRYAEVYNRSNIFELEKGSGRRWTVDKDLDQLMNFSRHPFDEYEIIQIVGKNPFLWHDHWQVKDYAKVFECLVLVEDISREADMVITKIRKIGIEDSDKVDSLKINVQPESSPYVAVHMRIEKDWMIHCKKLEQRLNITEICSSKDQIMQRVGSIAGLKTPIVIYLAVADDLLEDSSILAGWKEGLVPYEKKRLGILDMFKKHPYLIQSAIDYEVCLRANVFVGNSFSTFSSLVVLDRTQKMIKMGANEPCGVNARWSSYAYNLDGGSNGPREWATDMSASSLQAISYGSNKVSCP